VRAQRLASLTALSAAAIAAGGHAKATIIYSGPLSMNNQIGFDVGSTLLSLPLPPGSGAGSSLARIRLYTQSRTRTSVVSSLKFRKETRSVVAEGIAFSPRGAPPNIW